MDNEFDFDLDLDIDTSIDLTPPLPPVTPAAGKAPKAKKEKKKGGFPKWLIVVLAVVVVGVGGFFGVRALTGGSLGGGGGVSLGGGGGDPLQRTMKGLAENETVAFLGDLLKNGELRAELGLEEFLDMDGAVALSVKTDLTDEKDPRAGLDVALKLKKNQVADLSLYGDTKQLVLSSDVFLPGKGLGVDLKHFSKNLDGSLLDPDSGSVLALDEDDFIALKNALSGDVTAESEALVRQMKKVCETAYATVSKSVEKHADKDKSAGELELGGESVKVNVVTYTADDDALYNIAKDALEWARDSKELKALIDMLLDNYPDLVEQLDLTDTLEEFYDELENNIEVLNDSKDENEFFEDVELKLSVYTSKSKKEILGLKLESRNDGRDVMKAEAFWGPTMAKLSDVSFKYDDGGSKYSGSYTVQTDDKQTFESVLKLKQNSSELLSGSIRWNKDSGDLTLKLADITVKGSLEKTADSLLAHITKAGIYGGEQKLDLTLSAAKSAKLGSAPAFKELLTMTEDDLEDLAEDLEDAAYDLLDGNDDLYDLIYAISPSLYYMLQFYF